MSYPLIELPIDYIKEFRESINKRRHLILNNGLYRKEWNILCACMDRIEDAVRYLNSKVLGEKNNYGCAFDLIEFLSYSAVMLDCVDTLIEILKAKNEIDVPEVIFRGKTITNQEELDDRLARICRKKPYKNEDDLYFEYIRSIGAIHPNDTDRHPYFQQYKKEVSPFLIWNKFMGLSDGDIALHVYDSDGTNDIHSLRLQLSEIYAYIMSRYNRMLILKKVLNLQISNLIKELKSRILLSEKDFNTYGEYLSYLRTEAHKRSEWLEYCVEGTAKMLNLGNMPEEIIPKYSKYCKALKYAVEDFRKLLQSSLLEDVFNEDVLIQELHLADILYEDRTNATGYYYEKAARLYDEDEYSVYDIDWSRVQANELYKIVKRYAPVDDRTLDRLGNLQLLAVLNTALYFYSLEHNTFINRCMPKTDEYR